VLEYVAGSLVTLISFVGGLWLGTKLSLTKPLIPEKKLRARSIRITDEEATYQERMDRIERRAFMNKRLNNLKQARTIRMPE